MKRIKSFVEQYHMITRGDRLVAGVSGGADSVCLFFVLLELREAFGFDFVAVHVNHGLRGAAADRDEEFVRELCRRHDIELEVFRVELESIAKKRKQSLEEAGRLVRREAFEKTAKKYGCGKIALAHHQNDNAETLLWNLSRGTGLRGLGGIRPVNGKFIRPLLCMSRQEIEGYLAERGQEYCTDETNAQTDYTRNKLRHLVIPVLEEQVNAQAVRHMNAAMEQIWEVQDYMEEQVQKAYERCARRPNEEKDGGGSSVGTGEDSDEASGFLSVSDSSDVLLGQQEFAEIPTVLQKPVIRQGMEEAGGQMRDIAQAHIEAVRELFEKQVGKSVSLPYGLEAKRVYEGVRIQRKAAEAQTRAPVPLVIPGDTRIPDKNMTIRCKILEKRMDFSVNDIPEKVYTKWFDYDIIRGSLYLRTREPGDRIGIDREGHSQKLKSWFVNEKVPAELRTDLLLIAEENHILWIPGYRMSTAYQVREHTKRLLEIEIIREQDTGTAARLE